MTKKERIKFKKDFIEYISREEVEIFDFVFNKEVIYSDDCEYAFDLLSKTTNIQELKLKIIVKDEI
jgi:septin family protein